MTNYEGSPSYVPDTEDDTYSIENATKVAEKYLSPEIEVTTDFNAERGLVIATIQNGRFSGRRADVVPTSDKQGYFLRKSDDSPR